MGATGIAEAAVVEIVSVELAELGPGVSELGENEHELKAGSPEQFREMALPKEPNWGLMVIA